MISQEVLKDAEGWKNSFQSAKPFKHVCIDNFFDLDKAEALLRDFPAFDKAAAVNEFGRPSGKVTKEKLQDISPFYKTLHEYLLSPAFLAEMSALTGIENFVPDPTFFGGGTHENIDGQELDPHVDFNYLDDHKLHRRVNLLLYLNEEWSTDWGGAIQLHENPRDPENDKISSYNPIFNRAVIFETNEISWHGFPRIKLPEDKKHLSRKSLSVYFYTKDRPGAEKAGPHATFYVQRPFPSRFSDGYVLSNADVSELQHGYQIRDSWIATYQKKEESLGRQNLSLEQQIAELNNNIRLPITGFARQVRLVSGALYHDCWASQSFCVELRATRSIRSVQLKIEIPEHFPKVQRAITFGINERKTTYTLNHNGVMNFVVPVTAEPGATFQLSVACDVVFNPQKAGQGNDGRDLAFRIDEVLAE